MKQKYVLILVSFILGVMFLGTSLLLLKKAKPFITKVKNRWEEGQIANLPEPKEPLVISDSKNLKDLEKWEFINADGRLSNEHATSGKYSLKINFKPSGGASAAKIENYFEKNRRLTDWSRYEVLSFDIFNSNNNPARAILQIKDKRGKRKKIGLNLRANTNNHIEIDISELGGNLQLTNIVQFNIFLWKNKKNKTFYLDNIRLLPSSQFTKHTKPITSDEFLPKTLDEIYKTDYYFDFSKNKLKWLKQKPSTNETYIEVPLYIKNTTQSNLKNFTVSGGVPFPFSQLNSLDNLELVDSQGNSIYFQAKVLSRWPDKSIKWALITLRSDISPREKKQLYLRYSDNFKKQLLNSSLIIKENSDSIVINTGVLKLSINKKSFYLFDSVWLDKNSDGKFGDNEIISSKVDLVLAHNGREYFSHLDKNSILTVEEKGPVRVCLKAKGWFISKEGDKFCQFVIRIYAFEGSSYLKVQHTFIYTGYPENQFHYLYKGKKLPNNETIDAVYLKTAIKIGETSKFSFAADNKVMQGNFVETVEFLQNEYNSYDVVANGKVVNSGNKLNGWIELSDNEASISIGIKNFWEQFPKGFLLDKKNKYIVTYLWPKKAGALDFKTTEAAYGPSAYARGSAFGIAKTHDIFFYFNKTGHQKSGANDIMEGLISDTLIIADPKWTSDSKVLGKIQPYDNRFSSAEEFLSRLFDWGNRQIANFGWYGMVDFGDTLSWYRKARNGEWGWHPKERWGWFNCEGVGTHSGALIQFLRTGLYKYLIFGKNLARHIMDIDTCHYNTVANDARLKRYIPDDYSQVGSMHRHNGNHWGGRNEEASHTNVYGLLLYYYITGDARARDVIDEIGQFFLNEKITYYNHPDIAPQRTIANVLWGDVLLYELTEDEQYKKAADKWAQVFYEGQKGNGAWTENYNPIKKRWEGKSHVKFSAQYTIPALISYHQLTGNKAIANCIIKATDFIIQNEKWGAYFDASAYSYWITGDKKYLENLRERIAKNIKSQRKSTNPLKNGMIYEKAYYLRPSEFLYKMPFVFKVLINE